MDRNADQDGGLFFLQGAEDLPRERAGAAEHPGRGDEREEDGIQKPVDVLRRNGGEKAITVAYPERLGEIKRLTEQVCGGLGPSPRFSGGTPSEKRDKGLVRGADKLQGLIAKTASLHPDQGRAFRRFDGGIRQDQPEGFRFVHLPEDLGMKGVGEDEGRGACQRGQQGGQEMGPVRDAEADRIIGGCVQTDESVPDSNRQLPDLPDGRSGRREAMLPVFKKGKYRLVHLYFNIRTRLLVNDPMDVTAMGQ